MTGAFYIKSHNEHGSPWYMLLVRDTHFCLSCGNDLDKILKVLKDYVKTYKVKERLLSALRELDGQGRVSPSTFEQRESYYQAHGEDYADLVERTVRAAIKEQRDYDKEHSPLNKTRTRLRKAGAVSTIVKSQEVSPKVDSTPVKDFPTILRKPKVFNRK